MNDARKRRYVFGSGVFAYTHLLAIALLVFVLLGWDVFDADPGRLLAIVAAVVALVSVWWLIGPVIIVDGPGRQVIESPGLLPLFPRRTWPADHFEAIILRKPRFQLVHAWTVTLLQREGGQVTLQRYFSEAHARSRCEEAARTLGLPARDQTAPVPVVIPVEELSVRLIDRLAARPEYLADWARGVAARPPAAEVDRTGEDDRLVVSLKPVRSPLRPPFPVFLMLAAAPVLIFLLRGSWYSFPYQRFYIALYAVGVVGVPVVIAVLGWRARSGRLEVVVGWTKVGVRLKVWRLRVQSDTIPTLDITEVVVEQSGALRLRSEDKVLRFGRHLTTEQKKWLHAAVCLALAARGFPDTDSDACESSPSRKPTPLTRV